MMGKIAIIGLGREGQSLFNFLKSRGDSEIWICDKNPETKIPKGARSILGPKYLKKVQSFDVVFRSPGIPLISPEIQKAKKCGVEISSATKLFFDQLHNLPAQNKPTIIGITGTKGKGTTATILYRILKATRKNVFLAGNIGVPALNLLSTTYHLPPTTYIILELSSFQLQDLKISPDIAIVLDVFPDHLDAHKNLREYYGAKTNIAKFQKKSDVIFFFPRNSRSKWIGMKSPGKKIPVDERRLNLFNQNEMRLKGRHNFRNALMAASVAKYLGAPFPIIRRVISSFRGNEHRLEFVRKIKISAESKNAYVEFYNDSASTIPQPTAAAIKAFSEEKPAPSLILITGGKPKVKDYSPLINSIRANPPALTILTGQNKNIFAKSLKTKIKNNKIIFAGNLTEAVARAYSFARKLSARSSQNTVILFSPGAASFDQFRDYADRGRQFKSLIEKL